MSRALVIIPSFNERENIVNLIDLILTIRDDIDVLVVDDSSPDGTADAVRQAQTHHGDRLKLNLRKGKGGRGSAVLDGFRYAIENDYEFILEMDADFSHRPEEIPDFFDKIGDHDLVIGSRYLPQSEIHHWGWRRTIFSRFANLYARFILGIPISDYTNGYRLYKKSTIEALDIDAISASGYIVLSEVAYQLHRKNLSFGEVSTVFVNRRRGESNLSMHEIREAFLAVLRVRSPRLAKHAEQTFKFALTGGTATLIDMGTLIVLVELFHADTFIAIYPAKIFAIMYVFFMNKYFTFRRPDGSFVHQMIKFLVVYGVAFALNVATYSMLTNLGVQYILSNLLAIGFTAVLNYALLHFFVFHRK